MSSNNVYDSVPLVLGSTHGVCISRTNDYEDSIERLGTLGIAGLFFRQLFDRESCTYTYLLGDFTHPKRPAVIIDPVDTLAERDSHLCRELNLKLLFAMNTHVHADHVTGTGKLKTLPATLGARSLISKASRAAADCHVSNLDEIHFGSFLLQVRSTPGHTSGCVTYVLFGPPFSNPISSPFPLLEKDANAPEVLGSIPAAANEETKASWENMGGIVPGTSDSDPLKSRSPLMAFTGDALLIRGCGRTDFQEGDAGLLFDSVSSQIFSLPDNTLIFPAHDYKGQTSSSVWEEKTFNPRLSKGKEAFKDIMANLKLDFPKLMNKAVPANLQCGIQD